MPTGVYDRAVSRRVYGPLSEETKQKLRLANLGRKQSPELVKKRADALRGTKKTLEDRAAISRRMIGNKHGLGHRHTPESRKKMSQSARKGPDSNFWKGGKTDEAKLLKSS